MTAAPPGAAGRPPDLLFCRGCGGSIARRDLLAGRARLLEDRAYCAACAPASLARRGTIRAALVAAGIASVLLLGAASTVLSRRTGEAAAAARAAAESAEAARAAIDGVARRVDRLEAEARGLAVLVEAAGRGADAARTESRAARESMEDRLEGAERSLGEFHAALEGIRRGMAALQGSERLSGDEEEALLARMDDANVGTRFEVLFSLQRGSGPAARAGAVKGLGDPEGSVRYQAAVLARTLKVTEARPALVRCLSFPSPAVRTAAIDALREMDGTDLGFDPLEPSEPRRAEAVHRWEERLAGR